MGRATMSEGRRHRALVEGMKRPVRGGFASVLIVLMVRVVVVDVFVDAGVGVLVHGIYDVALVLLLMLRWE